MTDPIEATLSDLRAPATIVARALGPRVVRVTLKPARGIRARRIMSLGPDLAMALGVDSVHIETGPHGVTLDIPTSRPRDSDARAHHVRGYVA